MRKLFLLMSVLALFTTARGAVEQDAIDQAIDRGLQFLLYSQQDDGSFIGRFGRTVALPSLAGMACLATGHLPGDAKYGGLIDRSLDYVLSHQDSTGYMGTPGEGRMYAHAIATLFLTEISGMVSKERQEQIDKALAPAIKVILDAQNIKKSQHNPKNPNCHHEDGGWRYTPTSKDSDTSCSGWCLMALRSARQNGAPVPKSAISRAVSYMHCHHSKNTGAFFYQHGDTGFPYTLSGAGILCLELCGRHEDPDSMRAARFLMKTYRTDLPKQEYKYYGMYYASQGLFQIGGEYWKEFSEWLYATAVPTQRADGSWNGRGGEDNPIYATSMMILSLAVPYRQLPVYQRDETVDE